MNTRFVVLLAILSVLVVEMTSQGVCGNSTNATALANCTTGSNNVSSCCYVTLNVTNKTIGSCMLIPSANVSTAAAFINSISPNLNATVTCISSTQIMSLFAMISIFVISLF